MAFIVTFSPTSALGAPTRRPTSSKNAVAVDVPELAVTLSDPGYPERAAIVQLNEPETAVQGDGVVDTEFPAKVMAIVALMVILANPDPDTVTVVPDGPLVGESDIDAASGSGSAGEIRLAPPAPVGSGARPSVPPSPALITEMRTTAIRTAGPKVRPRPVIRRSSSHPPPSAIRNSTAARFMLLTQGVEVLDSAPDAPPGRLSR
ncbi:MAG: hypothetical protein ACREDK_03395 [Thermoplasmata archaeon]